jgi:hypothetical protein
MVYVLLFLVTAAVVGTVLYLALNPALAADRCLSRINNAEAALEDNSEEAWQICLNVRKRLERFAGASDDSSDSLVSRLPDGSDALSAAAWSEVLLAIIESRDGTTRRPGQPQRRIVAKDRPQRYTA